MLCAPSERWRPSLLYTQVEELASDIMLIENFR